MISQSRPSLSKSESSPASVTIEISAVSLAARFRLLDDMISLNSGGKTILLLKLMDTLLLLVISLSFTLGSWTLKKAPSPDLLGGNSLISLSSRLYLLDEISAVFPAELSSYSSVSACNWGGMLSGSQSPLSWSHSLASRH